MRRNYDGTPGGFLSGARSVDWELSRKINYEDVEVSSTLSAFAVGCGWSECYTAYAANFTIINNTDAPLAIDGNKFQATLRAPTEKEIRKWWGKKANPADFAASVWEHRAGAIGTYDFLHGSHRANEQRHNVVQSHAS